MRKNFSKRIKITKNGKIIRRARGLGHSRANKSAQEKGRRRSPRSLGIPTRLVRKRLLAP